METQLTDFDQKRKDVEMAFAEYADSILKYYSDNTRQLVLKYSIDQAKVKWINAVAALEAHFPLGTT